jgi:hypothetical protein
MKVIAVPSGQVHAPELRMRHILSNGVPGAMWLPSGIVRSATKTASGRSFGSSDCSRQTGALVGVTVGWTTWTVTVGVGGGLVIDGGGWVGGTALGVGEADSVGAKACGSAVQEIESSRRSSRAT